MSSACTSGRHGDAVALQPHLAPGEGGAGQVVDDDVGAQPRGRAVGGGVAQVGRAEVVVGELGDQLLGHHLALAVGRHRVEVALLGDRRRRRRRRRASRRRRTGSAARRPPWPPAAMCAAPCGVDGVGRLRVEVADRVVGDRGEVHHRVEAREVLRPLRRGCRRCATRSRRAAARSRSRRTSRRRGRRPRGPPPAAAGTSTAPM